MFIIVTSYRHVHQCGRSVVFRLWRLVRSAALVDLCGFVRV